MCVLEAIPNTDQINIPLWHRGKITALQAAVSGSIPNKIGIINKKDSSLGLGGMVEQNLNY